MSFYNLSFFEAPKLFERPSSKQGFARRTKDFPAMSSQPQNKAVRRQTSTGGYSYTSIVKRKRSSTPPSQGYDRTAHKQALLPSISRINSSPLRSYDKSTTKFFAIYLRFLFYILSLRGNLFLFIGLYYFMIYLIKEPFLRLKNYYSCKILKQIKKAEKRNTIRYGSDPD